MRLGPATQAALLSRMLLTAVFRPQAPKHRGKRTLPTGAQENASQQRHAEARAPVWGFSGSILPWKRRISEEAAMPRHLIHWTESDFPRRLTLERITGNTESWSAALRNISRFDCIAICRSWARRATANFILSVHKLWSDPTSCGREEEKW